MVKASRRSQNGKRNAGNVITLSVQGPPAKRVRSSANSSRSAAYNARRLADLGIAANLYDHFVTSGDVAKRALLDGAARLRRRARCPVHDRFRFAGARTRRRARPRRHGRRRSRRTPRHQRQSDRPRSARRIGAAHRAGRSAAHVLRLHEPRQADDDGEQRLPQRGRDRGDLLGTRGLGGLVRQTLPRRLRRRPRAGRVAPARRNLVRRRQRRARHRRCAPVRRDGGAGANRRARRPDGA